MSLECKKKTQKKSKKKSEFKWKNKPYLNFFLFSSEEKKFKEIFKIERGKNSILMK
jgi:hypothetical protein